MADANEYSENLNRMKMLGVMHHEGYEILKVPGGWIFTRKVVFHQNTLPYAGSISSVFVPKK